MGCCYSRTEREEMVSRCRARKRYMKQFVKARHSFSASHIMYLRALRNTGAALLQFADAGTTVHHHHSPPTLPSPPPPQTPTPHRPPPPPPMSPSSETWTTSTTNTAATPLPPPPPPSSTWGFWDPFMPSSARSGTVEDEEWEEMSGTGASETAAATTVEAAPPSAVREMAVVVSTKSKDVLKIMGELDEYFLRAADSGGELSAFLEVPASTFPDQTSSGKVGGYGKNLSPFNRFLKLGCHETGGVGDGAIDGGHSSTVERLCAWEMKLYDEVKNAESLKMDLEKRREQVRKLELKRADYMKTEKTKKEVEKLESKLMVSSQAIGSTSDEIVKLREAELYPQLLQLVKGLMGMWRLLYESHQVQMHIVQQLKYVNGPPSTGGPTSELERQSALQLEIQVQEWHISFCNLVKSQRDYVQSLTGWLRLSLFQFTQTPVSENKQDSAIYAFSEEFQLVVDNAPDKVASEGIKTLLNVIHAIVIQQAEEQKQKKRAESSIKELERKMIELRTLESKHGPFYDPSGQGKDPVGDKRAKVELWRSKAEEEKVKYEKSTGVTKAMTLNSLQMGLPHVFQAVTGFASVWAHAFESAYNHAKRPEEMHNDVKRLML